MIKTKSNKIHKFDLLRTFEPLKVTFERMNQFHRFWSFISTVVIGKPNRDNKLSEGSKLAKFYFSDHAKYF